jgi:hypothetical protein
MNIMSLEAQPLRDLFSIFINEKMYVTEQNVGVEERITIKPPPPPSHFTDSSRKVE